MKVDWAVAARGLEASNFEIDWAVPARGLKLERLDSVFLSPLQAWGGI